MTLPVPLPGLSADPAPDSPESGWPRLGSLPLTVLVGVTGVGKSTALGALDGLSVLPDRREVTDAAMILPLTGRPVSDREERFRLTALYRREHPGGMAQALGELRADPARWGGPLVFDGLRGEDEVRYAAGTFPAWRFVGLHARDAVRVRRLLGRGDAFDQVGQQQGTGELRSDLDTVKGIHDVFGPGELDGLVALCAEGHSAAEVLAKVRIVVSERRSYDPAAARAVLAGLPAERALDLDTERLSPAEVAGRVRRWQRPERAGGPA